MTQHQADGVSELERCPFCGTEPSIDNGDVDCVTVECPKCKAQGPLILDDNDAVIPAWNTRHLDPVLADMREALRLARTAAASYQIRLEPHELEQVDAALSRSERKDEPEAVDYCRGHCAGSRCDGTCIERRREAEAAQPQAHPINDGEKT